MQPNQASSTTAAQSDIRSLLPSGERRARLRRWRSLKDKMSRYGIAFAGISVVLAFATIFVYLFSEVGPIFSSASTEQQQSYQSPEKEPLFANLERYGEVGLVANKNGELQFFNAQTGVVNQKLQLALPEGASISSFSRGEPRSGIIAFGLSNGQVLVAKH